MKVEVFEFDVYDGVTGLTGPAPHRATRKWIERIKKATIKEETAAWVDEGSVDDDGREITLRKRITFTASTLVKAQALYDEWRSQNPKAIEKHVNLTESGRPKAPYAPKSEREGVEVSIEVEYEN